MAWYRARKIVQASAYVELGLLPPDTGNRAMPHSTTAHDASSYIIYEPPILGRRRSMEECWEPGGCTKSTCHCRRVEVSKLDPQEHWNCGPEGGGSEVHADRSVATQLSRAKCGRASATLDHNRGRKPGSVMEHGRSGSSAPPTLVTQGQFMVSLSDDPGRDSWVRTWPKAIARSKRTNVLPIPP